MDDSDRETMVARWLELTRDILPGMAAKHRWPIRLDHCFMRVCLDAAIGHPWHEAVPRPAVRHLTDEQLARAVAIAERIRDQPGELPALNASSLDKRRRTRRSTAA